LVFPDGTVFISGGTATIAAASFADIGDKPNSLAGYGITDAATADHTHDVASLNWATIYARTSDPGVAGQPWNDNGQLRFSVGITPSLDFQFAQNSMYLALLIEEF
jgi:hypothetical protein